MEMSYTLGLVFDTFGKFSIDIETKNIFVKKLPLEMSGPLEFN